MSVRTSITHPLEIAEIGLQDCKIGLSICPGKIQAGAMSGNWERDLHLDLEKIRDEGYTVVVSLIEDYEFDQLSVSGLRNGLVEEYEMKWHWAPIQDFSIPLPSIRSKLNKILLFVEEGESVFVHCKGGLGRAGLVVAWLLTHFGRNSNQAINEIRQVRRPTAIETAQQEKWVRDNSGIRLD
jgi:ADP-ribosyl-[dinitrogen reductase] hydrolase